MVPQHHHYFNNHFPLNLCYPVPLTLLPSLVPEETFGDKWHRFLWARYSSCHWINSGIRQKEVTSTVPNQWPSLIIIFSLSTTRLLRGSLLLCSCQFSHANTFIYEMKGSAISEGLHDVLCQLKSCQLLHTCTINPISKRLAMGEWTWRSLKVIRIDRPYISEMVCSDSVSILQSFFFKILSLMHLCDCLGL